MVSCEIILINGIFLFWGKFKFFCKVNLFLILFFKLFFEKWYGKKVFVFGFNKLLLILFIILDNLFVFICIIWFKFLLNFGVFILFV